MSDLEEKEVDEFRSSGFKCPTCITVQGRKCHTEFKWCAADQINCVEFLGVVNTGTVSGMHCSVDTVWSCGLWVTGAGLKWNRFVSRSLGKEHSTSRLSEYVQFLSHMIFLVRTDELRSKLGVTANLHLLYTLVCFVSFCDVEKLCFSASGIFHFQSKIFRGND